MRSTQYNYRVHWTENRPAPHTFVGKLWIFNSRTTDPVDGMAAEQVIESARRYLEHATAELAPVGYDVSVVCEQRDVFDIDGTTRPGAWDPLTTIRDEPEHTPDVPPADIVRVLKDRLASIGRT